MSETLGEASEAQTNTQALVQETKKLIESTVDAGEEEVIEESSSGFSLYCGDFLRPYFDVTTEEIQRKLVKSILVWRERFLNETTVPDFYGPFWIATTLLVMLPAISNCTSFLERTGDASKWSAVSSCCQSPSCTLSSNRLERIWINFPSPPYWFTLGLRFCQPRFGYCARG